MHYSRRSLLRSAATLTAIGSVPQTLSAFALDEPYDIPPIQDPRVKALCDTALDAATSAGATYADVRLTHSFVFKINGSPGQGESMTFGVRVLMDGYWGFASSPVWDAAEATRLAQAAVHQAKANVLGNPRVMELAPIRVTSGHWTMPVLDDVFAMSRAEVLDFFGAIRHFIGRLAKASPLPPAAEFMKQERAFASSEGQFCTQRLYRTGADIGFEVSVGDRRKRVQLNTVSPAGAGFEYLRDQPLREQILQLLEESREDLSLPLKPVDVGRYEVVLDAATVAGMLSQTIGTATEVDRALGYEANAGGTSYITDPAGMIGSLKIGTPVVTVLANRSEPGGVATVKWDDEGVAPRDFTLIRDGILTDMQTTREGAVWLRPAYDARGETVESHGCSFASEGIFPQLTQSANLRLRPGNTNDTIDSLIKGVRHGVVFKTTMADMDFQQITGFAFGPVYEVKNGKRTAELTNAGMIFRTSELWSNATAVGGAESQIQFGLEATKGQPAQSAYRSVTASPMTFKEMTVVDMSRKA